MCYTTIAMKLMVRGIFLALIGLLLLIARPVKADYNINQIVTDDEFTDYLSMSAAKIQEFLNLQPGILKNYSDKVEDGTTKTAAQIIYQASQDYKINPKVILTTLQKEESLLTMTNPNSTRINFAMGYGCPDASVCNTNYAGFAKQVDVGAWQFRRYIDNIAKYGYTAPTTMKWGPGLTNTLPCHDAEVYWSICKPGSTYKVTPANSATAGLYTYSPHASSNKSFWTIWNNYSFGSRRIYPDGSLLRASGSKTIYLIQNGQKRKFASMAAFYSRYSMSSVVTVTADHLFFYDNGPNIKFANYSLLRTPRGGIYLLVDDSIRPFASKAAFRAAGFLWQEVINVKWGDLTPFAEGSKITTANVYPSGQILQVKIGKKISGLIYYVQDGIKHRVISKQIFTSQFGKRKTVLVSEKTINKYTEGNLIGFKNGELVTSKNGGPVYFISNGYKLPFASPEALIAYKYDKVKKIVTDDDSLAVHPTGPTIEVDQTIPVQVASSN